MVTFIYEWDKKNQRINSNWYILKFVYLFSKGITSFTEFVSLKMETWMKLSSASFPLAESEVENLLEFKTKFLALGVCQKHLKCEKREEESLLGLWGKLGSTKPSCQNSPESRVPAPAPVRDKVRDTAIVSFCKGQWVAEMDIF